MPDCQVQQISSKRWGAAAEVDVDWLLVFMVFVHYLWVWKGRIDVSERV